MLRYNVIVIALIATVTSTAYCLLFASWELRQTPSGFQGADLDRSTARVISLSVSCIVGILSKFLFDRLKQKYKSSRSFYHQLVSALKVSGVAIVVSPIIILGVYGLLEKVDDPILLILIGYQNGFFFQTILASKQQVQETLL